MSKQADLSRLKVMNFLNEVAADYPNAISFASGRPAQQFFDVEEWLAAPALYQRELARRTGKSEAETGRLIMQYGRTGGMINELVAEQLSNDDAVNCRADQVMITAGCQEAMALCIQVMCPKPGDVLLVRNPTYIGATGAADLVGVDVVPLDSKDESDLHVALRETAERLKSEGRRARAIYLIPEFDNPTGTVLSAPCRKRLLEVCAEQKIVVLEDNPYGLFRFGGEPVPPMWALDQEGCVVYLGTYSKTLCPAVRVGCAVVPDRLFGDSGAARDLATALAERKSFLTVNTSQINQALVGGVLIAESGSLRRRLAPAVDYYRRNRDLLVQCLQEAFRGCGDACTWNIPEGGFFLTLRLPFRFGQAELIECAGRHRVIPMPMSYFSFDNSNDRLVRLAFSNISSDSIRQGVGRFAAFVDERCRVMACVDA